MAHSPCSWKEDVDHRLLGCKTVRRFQNSGSLLSLLRQEHSKGYRDVQSMSHSPTETAQDVRTASLNQPAMPTKPEVYNLVSVLGSFCWNATAMHSGQFRFAPLHT